MWKHCLGELIWGAAVAVGRLEKDSETHLDSLDKYIDPIMEDKLAEIDPLIDWECFRPIVASMYYNNTEKGGRNF